MYVPHHNASRTRLRIRSMGADIGSAQLTTVGSDGFPLATLLPVLWDGDTVTAHFARANPQWVTVDLGHVAWSWPHGSGGGGTAEAQAPLPPCQRR